MTRGIINTDVLPLRYVGKQWILRKRLPSGKRLERGLGTADKREAERRARMIIHDEMNDQRVASWAATVLEGIKQKGWLWRIHANVKHRSRKKGGTLDLRSLEEIAMRSGGLCEVSGIPFYLGSEPRHPFKPSIDRIDSTGGYDPWNIRLVALSVNYCMSHWGEQVFLQVSAAMLSQHLKKIARGGEKTGENFYSTTHD